MSIAVLEPPAQRPRPAGRYSTHGAPELAPAPKILLVEDDASLNLALRVRFEAAGFDTFSAFDGLSGLRKARAERPEVVLVDLSLPRMNGLTLTQQILETLDPTQTKVLLITGDSSPNVAQWAAESGACGILYKPFASERLVRRVIDLIGL